MNKQGFPPELAGIMGLVIAVACAALLLLLVIYIFYLLTLQKALSRCSPRNRLMEPAMVWLYLIPCFNLIWQFFIATRIPDSLKNEFRDRDRDDGSDYGKTIAMTQAVLGLLNVPLSMSSNLLAQQSPEISLAISGVSMILSLIGLVLFIVFWVKIANYSRMLGEEGDHRGRQRGGYDDDDDDDDYGRDRTPRGGTPKSDGIKAGDRD